jgi:hypothetical protein
MRPFYTALFVLLLAACFAIANISTLSSQEKALKKLYISSIQASGVPEPLAKKARERIEFALYENFGREYRVLTDEDVKVMFKKAQAIMATGCTAESCQTEIADAVDADEIIYGELTRDGGLLRLTARTLLRDRKTLAITKKSMVVLAFTDKELDHYASEAAKKLINPAYAVRKPPAIVDDGVSLAAVKIEEVKGLDIAVMRFTSDDATIQTMITYLKGLVEEGDEAFNDKKYDGAIDKYTKVLELVKKKLSADKQARMADFTDGVLKRSETAYSMRYKTKIEEVDKELKKRDYAEEKQLLSLRERYVKLETEIAGLPEKLKGEVMAEIIKTLSQRYDEMTSTIVLLCEKRGDMLYGDYKFTEALAQYRSGGAYALQVRGPVARSLFAQRLGKKEKATTETGQSYLLSRVRSLADRAELFNLQERMRDAKSELKEARRLIALDLSTFVTPDVVVTYNAVAGVLGVAFIKTEEQKKFEDDERRKIAAEALQRKEDERKRVEAKALQRKYEEQAAKEANEKQKQREEDCIILKKCEGKVRGEWDKECWDAYWRMDVYWRNKCK